MSLVFMLACLSSCSTPYCWLKYTEEYREPSFQSSLALTVTSRRGKMFVIKQQPASSACLIHAVQLY